VLGSFEAGDMHHDQGACTRVKLGLMDACLLDESIHVLTIMPLHGHFSLYVQRALYIGGVADSGSHLFGLEGWEY
jgi:hypothetical protein